MKVTPTYTESTPVDYAALINRLSRASEMERASIEQEILAGGPAALQKLVKTVVGEARHKRFIRRLAAGVYLVILLSCVIVAIINRNAISLRYMHLLTVVSALSSIFTVNTLRNKSASLLASFEDVRAIGALAELLDSRESDVRADAIAGLTKLLPKLTAQDSAILVKRHRQWIQSYLAPSNLLKYSEFMNAVLIAWIQVGDESAIPAVELLTQMPGKIETIRKMRNLAIECLSALVRRANEKQLAATLLRPIEMDHLAQPILLRPVTGPTSSDELLLLRPLNDSSE